MLASFDGHLAGQFGFDADEGCDGIESVEEEVRIDLALQRVEPCFEEEMLLLFEFHLDAESVPDLDGNADDDGSANPNQHLYPGLRGDQGEELAGKHARKLVSACFGENDEAEHEELPVDARAAQDAAYPAIEAKVDERRE